MTADPAPPAPTLDDLTPEQARALYEQALALRARMDDVEAVCSFGELVFGHIAAAKHREWIAADLALPRVALSSPPESAKTTWLTVITTTWLIGKHPERSYGIGTAGDNAADDMTKAVADTIEFNPRFAQVFPTVKPDKQRGWSSEGYHVRDNSLPAGSWEAMRYGDKNPTLVGGGVGSARWNGLRITGRLVLDDMHDRKSKTQQKTNDDTVGFFKDTAEYRVTGEAHLTIVQTRWNPKDIIALVKTRPDFKVFEHPAIVTDADGQEHSYWPAHHPLEKLRAIRDRSPIDFELVFQGNDKAIEGTVLKAEWLHSFPMLDFRKEWNRYFGLDPAKRVKQILKKTDDPDSFRLAVYADTGQRLVLEDVFGGVMFAPEAEDMFFTQASIFKPRRSGIEINGLGNEYYVNFLKRMRAQNLNYVLVAVRTSADMGERLAEMSPYFASAQILVSDADTPGLAAFRAEWLMFPRGHDDTLSAAHIAWRMTNYLLPSESVETRQGRLRAQAAAISPMKVIEGAYFR